MNEKVYSERAKHYMLEFLNQKNLLNEALEDEFNDYWSDLNLEI